MVAALALSLSLLMPIGAENSEPATYLDQIEHRIMISCLIPSNAHGLKVSLRFNLARSGRVSKLRVDKSSGNAKFDGSAVEAVRRASPFPRPPRSFPIGDLRLVLDPAK